MLVEQCQSSGDAVARERVDPTGTGIALASSRPPDSTGRRAETDDSPPSLWTGFWIAVYGVVGVVLVKLLEPEAGDGDWLAELLKWAAAGALGGFYFYARDKANVIRADRQLRAAEERMHRQLQEGQLQEAKRELRQKCAEVDKALSDYSNALAEMLESLTDGSGTRERARRGRIATQTLDSMRRQAEAPLGMMAFYVPAELGEIHLEACRIFDFVHASIGRDEEGKVSGWDPDAAQTAKAEAIKWRDHANKLINEYSGSAKN